MSKRLRIKFSGESGQGIDSIGKSISQAIVRSGYHLYGYREYPSLIKGGFANYQMDISETPIKSASNQVDILVAISRYSLYEYIPTLAPNGTVLHSVDELELPDEVANFVEANNIQIQYVPALKMAKDLGGTSLMENVVLVGVLWQVLQIPLDVMNDQLARQFASKPKLLEIDLLCAKAGYEFELKLDTSKTKLELEKNNTATDSLLIDGNYAISKGAIAAGVRAFYAYPMTPSSSVLTYLSDWQFDTKMVVKQVEDEISAANMTLGSSFMGTRAMTGTSGGGFDLMTETVSLAGITETPMVVLLAQRPGPGTGLPTWTMASDLNLALYGGHGESARVVLAAFDPESAYRLTQVAHNLAEQYRIPVIILSEKQIAEHLYNVASLGEKIPIVRQLPGNDTKPTHANEFYGQSSTGVSKRWFPGENAPVYLANSDEHNAVGDSIEDGPTTKAQYEKRNKKLELIVQQLPKPTVVGNADSQNVIVGWGSTENTVHDYLHANPEADFAYINFEYIWPMNAEWVKNMLTDKNVYSIENNYTSQLMQLITSQTGIMAKKNFTKYDGRGFYIEEMQAILEEIQS